MPFSVFPEYYPNAALPTMMDSLQDKVVRIRELKAGYPDINIAIQTFDEQYYNQLSQEKKGRFLKCFTSGIENPNAIMGCYVQTTMIFSNPFSVASWRSTTRLTSPRLDTPQTGHSRGSPTCRMTAFLT